MAFLAAAIGATGARLALSSSSATCQQSAPRSAPRSSFFGAQPDRRRPHGVRRLHSGAADARPAHGYPHPVLPPTALLQVKRKGFNAQRDTEEDNTEVQQSANDDSQDSGPQHHFPPIPEDKQRALAAAIGQVEKSIGKGAIMRLGGAQKIAVERISSGALTLDIALGGGLPKGRVVEIFGPEASGKTTLALHAVAAVQAAGGVGVFIDAEHALDPAYAAALGVDVENLLISQPDNAEQALEILDHFIRSAAVDVCVIDSVAALVPRAEIEGDFGDAHVGLQARLMGQALRKISGSVARTGCIVIFLNQLRSKIGVMFGSNEVTTGGNALKFYSTVRMDIRRVQALKRGGTDYGARTRVRVVKNKTAPPFRVAEFDIVFGRGIDGLGCLVDVAEDIGVLERKGAWYSLDGQNVAQGRDNLVALLRGEGAMRQDLEKRVQEELARRHDYQGKPLAALHAPVEPAVLPPASPEPEEDEEEAEAALL